MNTKFDYRSSYSYFHRDLSPAERNKRAYEKIIEALALIEDEINMQSAYEQMDYSTLNMTGYKKCKELLMEAMKNCRL